MNDETRSESKEWYFDGSIWEFVRMVRWALVFRELIKENRIQDWSSIGTNNEELKKAARSRGITLRNIASEMDHISYDLKLAYAMLDLRKRSGLEAEEPE